MEKADSSIAMVFHMKDRSRMERPLDKVNLSTYPDSITILESGGKTFLMGSGSKVLDRFHTMKESLTLELKKVKEFIKRLTISITRETLLIMFLTDMEKLLMPMETHMLATGKIVFSMGKVHLRLQISKNMWVIISKG